MPYEPNRGMSEDFEEATYEQCLDEAAPDFGADGVADWIGSAVSIRWPDSDPEDDYEQYERHYALVCIDVLERTLKGYRESLEESPE